MRVICPDGLWQGLVAKKTPDFSHLSISSRVREGCKKKIVHSLMPASALRDQHFSPFNVQV